MKLSAEKIVAKVDKLHGSRGTWRNHWREVADFVLPRKDNIDKTRVKGEKVNQFLLDNTAVNSNVLLAGFLHTLLTNPNSQFFELSSGVQEIDDRDDVRGWLQKSSATISRVLNSTNFQTEVHESYIDLSAFGTACMSIEEDLDKIVRFAARPIQDFYIAEDNKGMITEVYRTFKWNLKQIIQEFGEGVIAKSRQLQRAHESGDMEKEFDIIHAVYPREISPGALVTKRPWISQHIFKDEKVDLKVGAFLTFPYAVPRWAKSSGEVYGRSPAMNALPECKTLNLMVETTIRGAQKTIDPPLQAPDDGFLGTLRTRPGAINFKRPGVTEDIKPILNDARVDFGFQMIEEKRQRIREAFFVDQLRLREGDRMTATEVEQRVDESFRFMGPVMSRMQSEFLRPVIERVYDIMDRREMFDDAPEILRDRDLDIQYTSMIARTQKQGEARAILRTIEQSTPFISADPSILDNIDGNKALKELARINNFPQSILRSEREVQKIRDGRAEAESAAVEEELKSNTADNISKVSPALQSIGGG
jgi:hypothetical protein